MHAGGVREIPDHERPGGRDACRLGGDVDDLGRAVVDHRTQHDGDVVELVEAGRTVAPVGGGDALHDVAVGREVAGSIAITLRSGCIVSAARTSWYTLTVTESCTTTSPGRRRSAERAVADPLRHVEPVVPAR